MASKLVCADCDKEASGENLLRAHICIWHLDDWRAFECDFCAATAHTAAQMRSHLHAEHDVKAGNHFTHRPDRRRQDTLEQIMQKSLGKRQLLAQAGDSEEGTDDESGETVETKGKSQSSGAASEDDDPMTDEEESTTEVQFETRKVLPNGQRRPTWPMMQCDSTFCVECDAPVTNGRATRHVYMKHMDDCPFVCGVCGEGRYESYDMKVHFGRAHPDDSISFEDRRGEIEQDFLKAYFSCFAPSADAGMDLDKSRSLRSLIGVNANVNGQSAAKQPIGKRPISAELTSRPTLPPRKVSSCGQRIPTWQMQQRDCSFCVECSRPVGRHAIRHVYAEHVSGHPFVCRLCSQGYSETNGLRMHFKRRHPDAHVAFDDKREELEQDFLHAFLACYALRPDVESPTEEAGVPNEMADVSRSEMALGKRKSDLVEESRTSLNSAKRHRLSQRSMPSTLGRPEVSSPVADFDQSTESESFVTDSAAEIYGLDDDIPKMRPPWQMQQRDGTFCHLCNAPSTIDGPALHIYKVHLSRKPFACSLCGQRVTGASKVKIHANRVHKGECVKILDYRKIMQQEFEGLHAKCFRAREKNISEENQIDQDNSMSASDTMPGTISSPLATPQPASHLKAKNHDSGASPKRCSESNQRCLSWPQSETVSSPADDSDQSTETELFVADSAAEVYGLDDAVPKIRQTWQMQQRDGAFCHLCNAPTAGAGGAAKHIYMVHLNRRPFACSLCGQRAIAAGKVKIHANRVHKGECVKILDYRKIMQQEFEGLHAKCFLHAKGRTAVASHIVYNNSASESDAIPAAVSSPLVTPKPASSLNEQSVPIMRPTWRMLQRDCSHCNICHEKVIGCSRVHVYRRHMGERPFTCSVCAKGFNECTSARTHLKNVHKNEQGGSIDDHRARLEPLFEEAHHSCFALKKQYL